MQYHVQDPANGCSSASGQGEGFVTASGRPHLQAFQIQRKVQDILLHSSTGSGHMRCRGCPFIPLHQHYYIDVHN